MISPQYLAGLIDGEGYLAIFPVRSKETVNPAFEPVIKIGMADESARVLFSKIEETFGGRLEKYTRLTVKKRIAYTYVTKNKKVVLSILDLILPHLQIKKQQAELLKEFCELPYEHPKSPKFNINVIHKRVHLYNELKRLKQPGSLVETK